MSDKILIIIVRGLIIIVLLILFIGLPYVIWNDVHSEKISINKKSWTCTETRITTILIYQPALKMSIPQSRTECINYRRNGT